MTKLELNQEIFTDYRSLPLNRLFEDYHRLRKNLKIKKEKTYPYFFPIKTRKKNNWLVLMSKAPTVTRYKDVNDINVLTLVYYWDDTGLKVHKVKPEGFSIRYTGHFFGRYNERMSLGIDSPLEIVKQFFIENGYGSIRFFEREDDEYEDVVEVVRDGLCLGLQHEENPWILFKTFVTKEMLRTDQHELSENVRNLMQHDLEQMLNGQELDRIAYDYKSDILKGFSG